MNDFQSAGASREEREPAPQTHADTKPADNDDAQAALRARIKALGPDAIAEIARGPNGAHMPQAQVRQFRDGLLSLGQDKLAALAAAAATAEAVHGRRAKAPTTAAGDALEADDGPPTTLETPEADDTAPAAPTAIDEAPTATGEAPTASTITILTSISPKTTGKAYKLEPKGALTKSAIASICDAKALMVEVPTAAALLAVLEQVTQSPNQALVLNGFKGGVVGDPFRIMTEKQLEHLLGEPVGEEGVYDVEGTLIAARLKRGMSPSCWLLIDADNPPGMPKAWTALNLEERLKMLEAVLPGVSACERVEYLSSSARVVKTGSAGNPIATHAMVRVSHPDRTDMLREHLRVAATVAGLSFPSPRYSRSEPGKVIGHEHRTLIDLAVIIDGRIVFEAKPDVSRAPGYRVIPAGARIVNPGGGVLDIGSIELPGKTALANYKQKTGLSVAFSSGRANLSVTARNKLKLETEIEIKGVGKPLSEWLAGMEIGEKLRCEAPFRASESEAAFIRKDSDTDAMLYDIGTNTTYPLGATFPDTSEEEIDRMSTPAPDPVMAGMNARYAFVESISAIFDLHPGKFENGEKKMPQIVPEKAMEARYKNKFVLVGSKHVNWFKYWFAHPDRNEFSDIGCYPPDRVPPRAFNMFGGFAVPAVKGSWSELETFLRKVICGNEPGAYDYLYKFVCWWVQNPCVTPEIAILLLGPQGIGKSAFVLEFLGGLIGHRHLLHFTNPKALTANHNEEWAWQLLRFFNEMIYGHDKAVSGMLKALDTEKEIRINPKFVKAYMTPNLALNIYATNENSGGLPIDHDDRRKLVLDVATVRKEDHAYFENLTKALRGGELSAFLYDAQREDLTGFNRRKVFKTLARAEVADTTATPEAAFLVHTLEQGVLPDGQWTPKPRPATGGWTAARGNAWPTSAAAVSTQALFGAYLDWVNRQRGKQTHSQAELYREFKSKLGDTFVREQIRDPSDPGKREYRYRFASLGDCRAAFDTFCGRPREWASASSATILQFPDLNADDGEEKI